METKLLAQALNTIKFSDFDEHLVEYAKMCIQDIMGVAIAGSTKPVGEIWAQYSFPNPRYSGKSYANCWNPRLKKHEYHSVAAYNAACGHLMDLDDLHNSSIAHLAVVSVPAAMAQAQRLHKSGKELIEAVACGYEAGARIGEAINPEAYWFWHTTGVVGSFASAAASGKLLGLSDEEMLNALGSAGTSAAGLWEFMENSSMSKSLHTANATLSGMRAAELAKLGFTGAHTIIEGKKGFAKALNPDAHLSAITDGLGTQPLKILSNSFKPYACCRHTHSANACIEWFKANEDFSVEDIDHIVDRTYQVAINTASNANPQNVYACKFSLQYCIAVMLIYGSLSEKMFSSEVMDSAQVRELMKKITVVKDEEIQSIFENNPNQWAHTIELHLKNGNVLSHRVDFPHGDFMNPFTPADADRKFLQMTDGIMAPSKAEKLLDNIHKLDQLSDINQLFHI